MSQYLTLMSAESTRRPDGRARIDLNDDNLARLFDLIEAEYDKELARFIVAMRIVGPRYPDDPVVARKRDEEQAKIERMETVNQRVRNQLGLGAANIPLQNPGDLERAGLRLPPKPGHRLDSVVDLFGAQVQVTIDGQDMILNSPFPADPFTLQNRLPGLEADFTTTGGESLRGRININQASEPVLKSVPGIDEAMARSIVSLRSSRRNGDRSQSISWLVTQGIVSMSRLRTIAPFITPNGDVQGGVAMGWTDDDTPVAAIRFIVDGTREEPVILSFQDLLIMPRSRIGIQAR